MPTIKVPLAEERFENLKNLAREAGVSPEVLAGARLEEWLLRGSDEFLIAARHVLEKNAELYRRLA